MVEKCPVVE
jgi:hypothetical protein